jgi:hypothetical protein
MQVVRKEGEKMFLEDEVGTTGVKSPTSAGPSGLGLNQPAVCIISSNFAISLFCLSVKGPAWFVSDQGHTSL